ncbi:MAG: extracellular solute-binding protein [Lachnospiraceae bacterium]|jgi:arabinogalactan oligomer/maltooligosaccharide transport system substrate-binding protein|nr:extracellular solute-binding protein [Lachnospiraceae bacterium]
MKKKVLACTLAAVLSVSMLAGCGNDGNSGSSSDAGSGSTQQSSDSGADAGSTDNGGSTEVTDVALKVWCPQNQVDTGVMAEQQAAFAAAHPEWNITWTTEIVGEDNAKTEVLKDVDAAADVFLFASDQLIELVDAGAIAQLGGEAEKLVKETIADSVRATAMIGDATYAIPFTHNTFFMFYDKTIMDESDVTSLEKIMAKETADNVYNYYFESSGGWKLGAYYYGAGLTVFGPEGNDLEAGVNWNNETGVAVTNYLIDLINNPKCAYDGEIAVSELIEDHRLGVWFDGSWNYDTYKNILGDDLGIGVIPTFNPDGNDYQMLGFYGSKCIGVNAHSKNMVAAVAFAAFLGNEENQTLRYQKSAQIPTNINAGASEAVSADPLAAVIVKEANEASVMQPSHSVFSTRYWTYAGAIPTEIRSGAINKDNVQEKLDAFVKAMTE